MVLPSRKGPMAVHCLHSSLAVQSLTWSRHQFTFQPHVPLYLDTNLLGILSVCLFSCLLFSSLPPNLNIQTVSCVLVFCLLHFHQTLWWTWLVQCTILKWGPKPQTRVTFTLHQSHPGSFILRMTLCGAHLPNNAELLIFTLRLSWLQIYVSFPLIPICYHCS